MVATEMLKLAMETEEGRKERLKKMVANHSAEASPLLGDSSPNIGRETVCAVVCHVNKCH